MAGLEATLAEDEPTTRIQQIAPVDEVMATTGFRPDVAMLRELRMELDPIVESPSNE